MNSGHKTVQQYIKNSYSHKYNISCESVDGKNFMPSKTNFIYQPDVVISDKKTRQIRYIIEVECDPMRKVIVGASILCDYSIGQIMQTIKPNLIFVVYTEDGIKQMLKFKERIKGVSKYCRSIKNISILSESDFKKKVL
ncbi:MAG: hypothetical protein Q8O74_08915 [bacterium]|nr:hypothetical protein [bacterium]